MSDTKKLLNILPKRIRHDLYRCMSRIRRVELAIESEYHKDEMKTPIHLCIGQEAVSAGVTANLKNEDYVFSNHRGHGHYLAKGGRLNALIAELYCRETGCSRGRGGSMHLVDIEAGLMGSSSIVGGGIPIAVGAALSISLRGERAISVVFFGDAASEEGVLFESMNFAALRKLPVLFVCENNFYSVCSHLTAREANCDISMRPAAFGIESYRVNGSDVLDVYLKTKSAVQKVRFGGGPVFLECSTYRWRAHSGSGDKLASKYRKRDEWKKWMKDDPVEKYRKALLRSGAVRDEEIKKIDLSIDKEIREAFLFAKISPLPDRKHLYRYLFHGGK